MSYATQVPGLHDLMSEAAAKDLGGQMEEATPSFAEVRDLQPQQKSEVATWVKWQGARKSPPHALSGKSAAQVAAVHNLALADVKALLVEKSAVIKEVAEWGEDAFKEHPDPDPIGEPVEPKP